MVKSLLDYSYMKNDLPVVVLCHGFLGNAQQWDSIIELLKKDYSIITMELPGHGGAASSAAYSMDDLSFCLNSILLAQDIHRVHLVGHSMGGYMCSAFAKAYSHKVSSLTLVNSLMSEDTPARKKERDRAIAFVEQYGAQFMSIAISNLFTEAERLEFEIPINIMKESAVAIKTDDVINALLGMRDRETAFYNNNYTIKYIAGAQDMVVKLSRIKEEAGLLNAIVEVLDCGHMSIVTNPIEVYNNLPFIEK